MRSGLVFDWLCFTRQFPGAGRPGYEKEKAAFWRLLTENVPTTPVMLDNTRDMHRVSNVFERGNWLLKGAVVTPGVPAVFGGCMPAGAPANRLGLAMWMTSKRNPLVSRTMVNRVWEQLFGTGIAETVEDLGSQGSPPTHRALLDYLAWQYMNTDQWSLKRLLKEVVMSATYREDSRVTEASLKADPFDRLYSRGARVRLSAEELRDQDLCICGQLSPELYGPSVFPYQPKGIWMSPYNGAEWVASKGGEQYRRALYTYWKRTASYPSMISFDATSREVCTVRRIRTNTPLQALVTLNDTVYMDMARHLARRVDSLVPGGPEQKIAAGYRRMMFGEIAPEKLTILLGLYKESLDRFTAAPADAREMLGVSGKDKDGLGVSGGRDGEAKEGDGMVSRRASEAAMVVIYSIAQPGRSDHQKLAMGSQKELAIIREEAERLARLHFYTRRHFLKESAMGLGRARPGLPCWAVTVEGGMRRTSYLLLIRRIRSSRSCPLLRGRPKSVIYLHMAGAPSQLELFDYKPELMKMDGQDCPPSLPGGASALPSSRACRRCWGRRHVLRSGARAGRG